MSTESFEYPEDTLSQTPFEINVRTDIDWDFSQVGRNFSQNQLLSYFWAAFSAGSPTIEGFFVRALRPALRQIMDDETLKRHVNDMLAQEIQHAAAHGKFNKHLESLGFDIDATTKYYQGIFKKLTKGLDPVDMMGVVAAGEHGLYSFALVYMRSEEIKNRLHPQARRLFTYHFLEEAEHGAVSHDQYRYFKENNYWHRLKTAWRARYAFSMMFGAMKIFMRNHDYKPTLRERFDFYYFLWIWPGMLRLLAFRYMEYIAPWYKLTFSHEDVSEMQKWDDELYHGPGSPESTMKSAQSDQISA